MQWWDAGWVQDSSPYVTEYLHVTPWLVEAKTEVKERKCGGLWMFDVLSGHVKRGMESSHSMDGSKKGRSPAK